MSPPSALCDLLLDTHLVARHRGRAGARSDGYAWERAVSGLLIRSQFHRRQHSGTLGLFGRAPASGASHEIDGAGASDDLAIWIEAKARARLGKSDVSVFDLKCNDLYRGACLARPREVLAGSWWPVLVSSKPVSMTIRRVCVDLRITLSDPERLSLANVLRAASRPSADVYLSSSMMSEFVRLAEPVVVPLQERLRFDASANEVRMSLSGTGPSDVGDLLFLQDALSAEIYQAFDLHRPGDLDSRGAGLDAGAARLTPPTAGSDHRPSRAATR